MEAYVKKWTRSQFLGYIYDIRTTNHVESINAALRSPRAIPVIHLFESIREMLTRWFFKRKKLISKQTHVEEKIDRKIEKGKTFVVYLVNDNRLLVRGDTIDCLVNLDKRTCSCGKYDLLKIPCRHAIKAVFFVGREPHILTDLLYIKGSWREAYHKSINPIAVLEDACSVQEDVKFSEVIPPETRRSVGRKRKHIFETVKTKFDHHNDHKGGQLHKCSKCGVAGHNRATFEIPIHSLLCCVFLAFFSVLQTTFA